MSIHHVKALLGHANVSTTDTYFNSARIGLDNAMKRIDAHREVQAHPHPSTSVQSEQPALVNLELTREML